MKKMLEGRFLWTADEIVVETRLVLHQGESLRCAVVDPKVAVSASHYEKKGTRGNVYRCKTLDGVVCPRCARGEPPKYRFGARVLVYRIVEPHLIWDVIPWLFGGDKFGKLRTISKRLADEGKTFLDVDLILTCVNEAFQNVKVEIATNEDGEYAVPLWKSAKIAQEVVRAVKEAPDVMAMIKSDREDFDAASAVVARRDAQKPQIEGSGKGCSSEELALFGEANPKKLEEEESAPPPADITDPFADIGAAPPASTEHKSAEGEANLNTLPSDVEAELETMLEGLK